MKSPHYPSGFTLLEVILAITILSTLSLLSTQTISRALKARTKIQAEVDDVSALRDSMRIIRTDLNLAYHHRDFEQEIADLVAKAPTSGTPSGTPQARPPTAPAPQRQTKRGDPATHFVGDENKMAFVTMNNGRISSNVAQADFIEVGYEVKDCRNLTTQKDSKCLYRRTQNILDDDVTTGGNEIVMLENVSEFKLRYIGDGKQDWSNQWKSTKESFEEVTKGKFPDAVEITLSIEHESEGKSRKYDMNFVVPIHFPNNPDKSTNQGAVPGLQPSNPSGVVQ
jgi:prepilin-type N-terminal cleavage/methylation domain-containing protein